MGGESGSCDPSRVEAAPKASGHFLGGWVGWGQRRARRGCSESCHLTQQTDLRRLDPPSTRIPQRSEFFCTPFLPPSGQPCHFWDCFLVWLHRTLPPSGATDQPGGSAHTHLSTPGMSPLNLSLKDLPMLALQLSRHLHGIHS